MTASIVSTVRVYAVRPRHAEAGMYDLAPDCSEFEGDLSDYIHYVRHEIGARRLSDAELAGVDGHIHDQAGTLVGWEMPDGSVSYECVVEVAWSNDHAKAQIAEAVADYADFHEVETDAVEVTEEFWSDGKTIRRFLLSLDIDGRSRGCDEWYDITPGDYPCRLTADD